MKLPESFIHKAPKGYYYEVEQFKKGYLAIWLYHEYDYVFAGGERVRTIWGFYRIKDGKYFAPINSSTIGKEVNIKTTRSYTSMPLNLNPLEQLLFAWLTSM